MKRPKEKNTMSRHEEDPQKNVRQPMHHLKRSMLVCLFTLVLTTLLTAGVAQAARLTGPTWSIVHSANIGFGLNDELVDVAAVSATDIWAVGDYRFGYRTMIEHWNGTSWKIVPSPNASGYNRLVGVAAVSATDVWAVGNYDTCNCGNTQTLIEHWDGTSWQIIPSPNPGSSENWLNGVAVVSATNIWAVGFYVNSSGHPQTLIEHWNGTTWQVVSSPSPGSLSNSFSGVAVVSATNIWAVGDDDNGTLIEHWNGTSWQIVSSPNVGSYSNVLQSIAAISASNIWAVGDYTNSNCCADQSLIEHWNGSNWQVVPNPNPGSSNNELHGVVAVSASNIWAVGDYGSSSPYQTLIEHWNGTNWQVVASPNAGSSYNYLQSVAAVSATDIWAVGSYYNTTKQKYQTLTELYS